MSPRVSVIMAAYNEAAFIQEAVESVLSQSFADFELIITDDGSTDATREIAQRLRNNDPRIQVIVGARNEGKPVALNRALAVCRGEFIAWLDGDDVMLPGKLERQVRTLDEHPSAAGCTHDAKMFDSDSGDVIGLFSQVANGSPMRSGGVELLLDPTYKMLPSATMIRSSFRPVDGFNEDLTFTNDWLFDIEVFRKGECIALGEALVRYRRHSNNFTTRADASGIAYDEGLRTMEIVRNRYPELTRGARAVSAAISLGHARRSASRGEARATLRYVSTAYKDGGWLSMWDIGRAMLNSWLRRRNADQVTRPFPRMLSVAERELLRHQDRAA